MDTICNRTEVPALFAENDVLQFLRNEFTRNPMADHIPMAIAQIAAKSMQERTGLFGVSLQLRSERNDGYVFPVTKGSNPVIGIEEIVYSQVAAGTPASLWDRGEPAVHCSK